MATKKAPRKRKETDVTSEYAEHIKKNFDCANIQLKKMYPLTDNHIKFYHLSQNDKTNMIFLNGPSGSCKSYLAVYTALELLKNRKVDRIIYIRTIVESASRSMGAIPGEVADKFAQFAQVMIDKGVEITDKNTLTTLIEQEYIKAIPVNFTRGLTFNNALVIFDEIQNAHRAEIITVLTRVGRNTKYLCLGDFNQSDIGQSSGFKNVFDAFDTDFSRKNDIHCLEFDHTDIVRSPILRHITQVLKV